jgi:polyisoprenoid-binding protein YceI
VTRYEFAPERSHLWIDARSNVHPIHASTDGLEGYVDIELVPDGGVDVKAEPTGKLSLAVDKIRSGNRMEDRELSKRIDSRRFPTIVGVLNAIEPSDNGGGYRVRGDVTFRGVTHSYEDLMNISRVDDRTVRLDGTSRFDIRQFGMEPPRVLMAKVDPEVDIRVEIVAVKKD